MTQAAPATTATTAAEPIPFRTDPAVGGGEAAWVFLATILLLGAAWLGLRWLKGRGLVAGVAARARSRIEVVASRRLTLHTVAVVVEVDGRRALVTESTRSTSVLWLAPDAADATAAVGSDGTAPRGPRPEPMP